MTGRRAVGLLLAALPLLLARCGSGDSAPGGGAAGADAASEGGSGSGGTSGTGGSGAFSGVGGGVSDASCIEDGFVNLDCGRAPPKLKCTAPSSCPSGYECCLAKGYCYNPNTEPEYCSG
jgi:hypothetical protein